VNADGFVVSASNLRRATDSYGRSTICADITYRNASASLQDFGVFDWSLQVEDDSGVLHSNGHAQGSLTGMQTEFRGPQIAKGGTGGGTICFSRDANAPAKYFLAKQAGKGRRAVWIGSL
jgi:hypothetical protein